LDSVRFNRVNSVITNCQHKFHRACLRNWISRRVDCPNCRGIITRVFLFGDIMYQRNMVNEMRPALNMQMAVVNVQNNQQPLNLGNVPVNVQNNIQQPLLANALNVPEEDANLGTFCCCLCNPATVMVANFAYLIIFALALLRTQAHKTFTGAYCCTTTGPNLGEVQGFDVYLYPVLSLIFVLIMNFNYRFKFLCNVKAYFVGYSIYHFLFLSFNFVGYIGYGFVKHGGLPFLIAVLFWITYLGFLYFCILMQILGRTFNNL